MELFMKKLIRLVYVSSVYILLSYAVRTNAQDFTTNGLVAYFPFNGNANDASGNANNATLGGNYQFVSNGQGHLALRAIGDNSQSYVNGGYILLPTFSSSLNSGFTLSVWVRDEIPGSGSAAQENYINYGTADLTRLEIGLSGSTLYWDMTIGAGPRLAYLDKTVNAQTYINSGWKHLVLAYQPGHFACYLNGQNLYQTNVTVNIFPVSQAALNRHWWNNGSSSSARMSATYQNVRIYSRALSDSEVQQLFSKEFGPTISLIKSVKPAFSNLSVGTNYQMQVSANLTTWANQGSVFTATTNSMIYPQYFDVNNWDNLFFRLQVSP